MCLGKVTSKWRNASSIILASSKTRRILMLKRGSTAQFMPDSLVFPGGVADLTDAKIGDEFRIGAIRELFEESGILLTRKGYESSVGNVELQKLKKETVENPAVFRSLENQIDGDHLVEWDTFLTPANHPKRYFTKFFVAVVEEEPPVDLCTSEMSEYCWVDPAKCIKDAFEGRYSLPPPQVYEMTRISQLLEWSKTNYEKFANTKKVICPQPVKTIGKDEISNLFPGDFMYKEDNIYNQPLQQLSADQIAVQKDKPTHRATYHTKPMYAKCRLYQHGMKPEDAQLFHQFKTHSDQL